MNRALDRVGLLDKAESHPYDLQYTDRKLIALAATLAMEAPILVLDEPTIGQDARQRERVASILQELAAQHRTILLVSHDLDFCARTAERVVVMAEGRILADGPTEQVLAENEILDQAAVIAPQLMRLSQALKLSPPKLRVDDFVDAYASRKARPT